MKLMKQKKSSVFLLCEYMGPTLFLYIYVLLTLSVSKLFTILGIMYPYPWALENVAGVGGDTCVALHSAT
jgi:hypothetical protein